MAGFAVSSLLPRGCRLPEKREEQAQHHSPRREKAASWYGAGDTKQTLDSMHPFGAAPNPVLSSQGSVAVPPHPFPAELVLVF